MMKIFCDDFFTQKIYAPFQKNIKISTLLYISEIQNWRIKIIRRLRVLPCNVNLHVVPDKPDGIEVRWLGQRKNPINPIISDESLWWLACMARHIIHIDPVVCIELNRNICLFYFWPTQTGYTLFVSFANIQFVCKFDNSL